MKKLILSFLVASLATLPLFSISHVQGEEEQIVILPANSFDAERPNRTNVPIEAYYNCALSSIIVFFSENLGPVQTTITNITTGDIFEDTINAYGTPAIFPVLQSGCSYLLLFTLPNGDAYYGEFDL
ncbi:MAG: hypothetical protein IKZ51_00395 [Bacteroidales bacterium]|nr:hypothetical protein [Bacteroidales bacterium]